VQITAVAMIVRISYQITDKGDFEGNVTEFFFFRLVKNIVQKNHPIAAWVPFATQLIWIVPAESTSLHDSQFQ